MGQRILNIRVRPARVLVLINQAADLKDLLLAFEFFSRLWGGRFGQLLAVDPKKCDELTEFRLAESRPEFIYGIGLDDKHWIEATRRVCQPRGYGPLRPEFVQGIKQAREDYLLIDHALIHLFQRRQLLPGQKQALRLIKPDPSSIWTAYCAVVFGINHPNLQEQYRDEITAFTANTTPAFISLATEFVKNRQKSWLDVTGHELNPRISGWGLLAPTIVLVQSLVQDLSLFWNLRTATDTTHPAWIIPIPADAATDPLVIEKLKDWLLAFLPHGPRPSYCHVTSQTFKEDGCQGFAELFQKQLSGSPVEAVDYEPPRNRIPVVIPYEYECTWPVEINGRKLTIQPPRPKAFEGASSRAWFVDLLKDVKTGRAVKELQLPPSPVVFELLNGPCPPNFEHTHITRTGDGTESINIRCSGSKEVVSIYLPTSDEVFGEILREYGVEPVPDEKGSSYLPVINRFGGVFLAASAFAGQSGTILTTLARNTKTLPEIRGACKLGTGELSGETYLQRIEHILLPETERMKRVSQRRYLEYAKRATPVNLTLQSLLEHWADRMIVMRQWKIGPCQHCNQRYFVPALNIQRRILCTNCGNKISLPTAVPIGYTLQRPVAHAIKEGIIPVAQTGRFLKGMTNQGFFWLPGVKYKNVDKPGDIDLLACCDGHLVFCECKSLEETPVKANACPVALTNCPRNTPTRSQVWDKVVSQFLETARIAKLCKGSLAVLASRATEYPQEVINRLAAELGTSIPYLLLTKEDLEKGYRPVEEDTLTRHLTLGDVLPRRFPEKPRDRTGKPRTINMGWGVYTS